MDLTKRQFIWSRKQPYSRKQEWPTLAHLALHSLLCLSDCRLDVAPAIHHLYKLGKATSSPASSFYPPMSFETWSGDNMGSFGDRKADLTLSLQLIYTSLPGYLPCSSTLSSNVFCNHLSIDSDFSFGSLFCFFWRGEELCQSLECGVAT